MNQKDFLKTIDLWNVKYYSSPILESTFGNDNCLATWFHILKKSQHEYLGMNIKVDKILKGSLDSISSPSPSMKIQIMCLLGVKAKHCGA